MESLSDDKLGKGPKLVTELFAEIKLAARRGVVVVIWDDADSIFTSRRESLAKPGDPIDVARGTSALLHGLERLRYEANVIQFATLNILSGVVDEAILSRNDFVLPMELPTKDERTKILARHVEGNAGECVLPILAAKTEGKSGRELVKTNMLAYMNGSADTLEGLTEEDYLRAGDRISGTEVAQTTQDTVTGNSDC